jgi:S-adenosylmethionine-diacylgycerolhomoserine-N-methlytransferase
MELSRQSHRDFLNRYYGVSRWFYDLTRRYYLFGRDQILEQLVDEPWKRLVEVGPGTGRNLAWLKQRRPERLLGGIDACDAMLEYARGRCDGVTFEHGFAEDADYSNVVYGEPDRILFSYCLSMVSSARSALEHARRNLAPGGQVVVVDFGDFKDFPAPFRWMMHTWLSWFHVHPLDESYLRRRADEVTYGPGRYFVIARFAPR